MMLIKRGMIIDLNGENAMIKEKKIDFFIFSVYDGLSC